MKRAYIFSVIILAFASQAVAGKIYGSITEGGKPVAQGVKVQVTWNLLINDSLVS